MTKIYLVILDGWGISPVDHGNPLLATETPGFDTLVTLGTATLLRTASLEGGLAWGAVGDSELGHYNLGTGRIVVARAANNQRKLISVNSRQQLMAGAMSPVGDEHELNETELTVPASLGSLVAQAGLAQTKWAIHAKLPLLTQTMNGYPATPLNRETSTALRDETKLEQELEAQPDLLGNDLVVINLSLADRAAHQSDIGAVIQAIRQTDANLQTIAQLAYEQQAILYLVSDHGNIEQMIDINERVDGHHTTSPVALIRVDFRHRRRTVIWGMHQKHKKELAVQVPTGLLADVAPTLLDEFGLSIPETMVGISLKKMLS